jgi:small subunit ribosomal protein S6
MHGRRRRWHSRGAGEGRRADYVGEGGKVATTDEWGRRKFAYPDQQEARGSTTWSLEIVTEALNLDSTDRYLRLADDIVRHKIMRLPDA